MWKPRSIYDEGVSRFWCCLGHASQMFLHPVIFIVRDNLAARLGVGSVTGFEFGLVQYAGAWNMLEPLSLLLLLPTISEQFARGDMDEFKKSVNSASVQSCINPADCCINGNRAASLVQVAFDFDPSRNDMGYWLPAFTGGMLGHALLEISTRTFYAQKIALPHDCSRDQCCDVLHPGIHAQ